MFSAELHFVGIVGLELRHSSLRVRERSLGCRPKTLQQLNQIPHKWRTRPFHGIVRTFQQAHKTIHNSRNIAELRRVL